MPSAQVNKLLFTFFCAYGQDQDIRKSHLPVLRICITYWLWSDLQAKIGANYLGEVAVKIEKEHTQYQRTYRESSPESVLIYSILECSWNSYRVCGTRIYLAVMKQVTVVKVISSWMFQTVSSDIIWLGEVPPKCSISSWASLCYCLYCPEHHFIWFVLVVEIWGHGLDV